MTVVVAVEGGVGGVGAVVEGAVTIVAAEEDDEGPAREHGSQDTIAMVC